MVHKQPAFWIWASAQAPFLVADAAHPLKGTLVCLEVQRGRSPGFLHEALLGQPFTLWGAPHMFTQSFSEPSSEIAFGKIYVSSIASRLIPLHLRKSLGQHNIRRGRYVIAGRQDFRIHNEKGRQSCPRLAELSHLKLRYSPISVRSL